MAGCSSDEALRYFLIAGDLRISITLSLVCNPLACCMLRVKPRFHFGFTSVIMKMDRNPQKSHKKAPELSTLPPWKGGTKGG